MHPNIGKSSRIDTLFNSNDNAFVVAFDHGILMGPIDGLKVPSLRLLKANPTQYR